MVWRRRFGRPESKYCVAISAVNRSAVTSSLQSCQPGPAPAVGIVSREMILGPGRPPNFAGVARNEVPRIRKISEAGSNTARALDLHVSCKVEYCERSERAKNNTKVAK
jgi:hypothetical protein